MTKITLESNFETYSFAEFTKKVDETLQLVKDTMLHSVIRNDDEDRAIKFATYLLGIGADLNSKIGQNTPMSLVTEEPCATKIARWLIENGVDVNSVDFVNNSFLAMSVEFDDVDYVKFLLDSGANINEERDGVTILETACYSHRPSLGVVELLLKRGAPTTGYPLVYLCRRGKDDPRRVKIAEALIEAGVDVNIGDEKGLTALAWAMIKGRKELVDVIEKHVIK